MPKLYFRLRAHHNQRLIIYVEINFLLGIATILSACHLAPYESVLHKDQSLGVGLTQPDGSIKFNDGTSYRGDVVDGKPNGMGELLFSNGDHYLGLVVNGKMHGKGELVYSDQRKYSGQMLDDIPKGQGILLINAKEKLVGEFNGLNNVTGNWYKDDGVYAGTFYDLKFNGIVTFTGSKSSKKRYQIWETDVKVFDAPFMATWNISNTNCIFSKSNDWFVEDRSCVEKQLSGKGEAVKLNYEQVAVGNFIDGEFVLGESNKLSCISFDLI